MVRVCLTVLVLSHGMMVTTAIVRFASGRLSSNAMPCIALRFSRGGGLNSVGTVLSATLRDIGSGSRASVGVGVGGVDVDATALAASFTAACAAEVPPLIGEVVVGLRADDAAVDFRYVVELGGRVAVFEWGAEEPAFSGDTKGLDKFIAIGFGQC